MFSRPARHGRIMKRKLEIYLRDHSRPTMSSMTKTKKIQLTPREKQLRHLLLDVAGSIDASNHVGEPVVLRWAGGWVRDKLLGIESHDIDVAINAMTGQSFAQHLFEHCKSPTIAAAHGVGKGDVGNLHKVASNPDKSKHLETAMVKLLGLDLDFVNLRKETYAEDSRNPQMEFGTPKEDALRRDATINALFYNLHTEELEDFTGGLGDMIQRIIRTPLEPLQTFMDDPLRVLRLIRFAARLDFTIHATTETYMSDPRVLSALKVKISRERVGVELEKMLKGTHPRRALELIDRLGLYHAVFTDPSQEKVEAPSASRWHVAYRCLDQLLQQRTPKSIADVLIPDKEATYMAWNLAAVSPWIAIDGPPEQTRKANALPPVAVIAREGFRAPNRLAAVMTACHRNHAEILELKTAVSDKATFIQERDRFGMAIRKWDAQGGMWMSQVLATMLVEAMDRFETWPMPDGSQGPDRFLQEWQGFLDHLADLDLYDAPNLKRLLDGRMLAKSLGVKPGVWTGKALDICMAWQLRHPKETDLAGAVEEVRKKSDELGITIPARK